MNTGRLSRPQLVSLVCMVVVAVAAFLPWISIFGIGLQGIKGDGQITLIAAAIGLVVFAVSIGWIGLGKHGASQAAVKEASNVRRSPSKKSRITRIVLAGIVAIIGLADMNGAAAFGLYLTVFAGIGWMVGGVLELRDSEAADSQIMSHDS